MRIPVIEENHRTARDITGSDKNGTETERDSICKENENNIRVQDQINSNETVRYHT